ncbi:MAG: hypothetical protein ABH865_03490 [Candidatus Omnitrophota bacterium]|nr:plasmid pRiA4b ORF-3 family protein [Candidatus Omnitrophota bacterium]
MSRKKQSKGKCAYCGIEIAGSGMSKHLFACRRRQTVIREAGGKKVRNETLYHLRVQDAWRGEFWLDLEMRGSSTLKDLDEYLRGIWLECCGHMSQFSIGGWRGGEIPKSRRAEDIFNRGTQLTHIYDFGTSSETVIKVAGVREGQPVTAYPIALMARNLTPEAKCEECGRPAAWLCVECLIEEERRGTLCDEHTKSHPHDNYGEPVPLVNSPRMGMCGYTGPAEPPY